MSNFYSEVTGGITDQKEVKASASKKSAWHTPVRDLCQVNIYQTSEFRSSGKESIFAVSRKSNGDDEFVSIIDSPKFELLS